MKGSIQDELDAYFEYADPDEYCVSKAAFCKARQKLKASAFSELRDTLNQEFYASGQVKTWLGHRLCAVDGSKINLPNNDEMIEKFGGKRNSYGLTPQTTLSQCYDPLNGLTLDVELSSANTCERTLAEKHLEKVTGNNIFLYDRGYPGYWFYRAHTHRGQYFCMRLSTSLKCPNVQKFLSSKSVDMTVDFNANGPAKRISKDKGFSADPLTLRLIKVALPSGETEILVSNLLDCSQYQTDMFSALYFKRWGVEEDFKQQKHTLLLERFSGKNVVAVEQDIEAKILTKNIARLIAVSAENLVEQLSAERKHKHQVNFKQLISKCKHVLVHAMIHGAIHQCIQRLILSVKRYIEPIREGRKYPRKRAVGTRSAVHGTYKGVR